MRRAMFPILALSLAAAPLIASAQTPVPAHDRIHAGHAFRGSPAARMLAQREALGLTADQVSRLEGIQSRLDAQNQPLLEQLRTTVGDSLLPHAFGARGRAFAREHMRARRGQLTPEQRAEMRERMEQLTPEQRAAMRARMQERRGQAHEQRAARPQLSEEQRAAVRPIAQQLRENAAQARRDAHTVLTPEQQEKLRELRPAHGRFRGTERGPRRSPDGR